MGIPLTIMGLILGIGLFGFFSATDESIVVERHLDPDCVYQLLISSGPTYKISVQLRHPEDASIVKDLGVHKLPLPENWKSADSMTTYKNHRLRTIAESGVLEIDVSPGLKSVSRIEFQPAKSGTRFICENQTIETF